MSSNIIYTFLRRDFKLINIRKLIMFILFVIAFYYVYYNVLFQYDSSGNIYLFAVGFKPQNIIDISMISLFSSLFFLTGITTLDLNEKISIGYSLVASKVKIINVIVARSIFCLICAVISLTISSSFFIYWGFSINEILFTSINSLIFTYTTYIALVFLFSRKKLEYILPALIVFPTMYLPMLTTTQIFLIINISYLLIVLIFISLFSERIYKNKLKNEKIHNTNSINYFKFVINNYIEDFSIKMYEIISRFLFKNNSKYLSLLYVDIQRYLKFIVEVVVLISIKLLFDSNIIVVFILSARLFTLNYQNYLHDFYFTRIKVFKVINYTTYKIIVSFVFNYIFLLPFMNFSLFPVLIQALLLSVVANLAALLNKKSITNM